MQYQLEHHKEKNWLNIQLKQNFSINDRELFEDIIRKITASLADKVIIDCSELQRVDSSALGMLIQLNHELMEKNITTSLYNVGGQVADSLRITRLDELLDVQYTHAPPPAQKTLEMSN